MNAYLDHEDTATVREALHRRREELLHRTDRVKRDLTRADEPLPADFADQAVRLENDETLEAIGAAARTEVRQIDHALERMARGLYGVCERCERPIAWRRLRAVPYATTCSGCG